MDVTKPYKFIGFGAMDVTKPYRFIGFGALEASSKGPEPLSEEPFAFGEALGGMGRASASKPAPEARPRNGSISEQSNYSISGYIFIYNI